MTLPLLNRKLKKEDSPAFYQLISAYPSLGWSLSMLESSLDAAHNIAYGLFSEEHDLVAAALFTSLQEEAELLLLSTHSHYLQQGAATLLLETSFKNLAKKGIRSIFLEVRSSNAPARSLYQKLGFKKIGIRKKYYHHPIEDAEIYTFPIKR